MFMEYHVIILPYVLYLWYELYPIVLLTKNFTSTEHSHLWPMISYIHKSMFDWAFI